MPDALTQALSAGIGSILGDGRYATLYQQWFGSAPGSRAHPYPPVTSLPYPNPQGTLARALTAGELRWGFALMGRPFSFARDHEICGWDLDLGRLLTEVVGSRYGVPLAAIQLQIPGAPFPGRLFDALNAGTCAAVLSDLAVTAERRERVDFTVPYLCATFGLLCARESWVAQLGSAEDANRLDLTLLVLRHAFLNELADRHLPRAQRFFVEDPPEIVPALLAGRADAALLPHAAIHAEIAQFPQLAVPDLQVGPGGLRAIATRKTG